MHDAVQYANTPCMSFFYLLVVTVIKFLDK